MPLEEGQVQVRDLVMGRGTNFEVKQFNPWNRTVRADYTGKNPWSDGGYSGPEFLDVSVVAMRVYVIGNSAANWQLLQFELMKAFDSVGTGPDVEIRWKLGGIEYLQRGRPTVVNPEVRALRMGRVFAAVGYRADDPLIYSGELNELELDLPQWEGGLEIPLAVPTDIQAVRFGGTGEVTNAGLRPASTLLRFNGPVKQPFLSVGDQTIRLNLTIPEGHWVDINTDPYGQYARYDGLPGSSVLDSVEGDWIAIQSGTWPVRYGANSRYHQDATALIRWRDTY